MRASENPLRDAIRYALSEVHRAGDNPDNLPPALRTVVIVHAAQGIIDNGGLQYFFESDFDEFQRPYSYFIDAYREIGANEAADQLAAAVHLFPFKEPHRHVTKRQEFLERFIEGGSHRHDSPFEPYTKSFAGTSAFGDFLRNLYLRR